MYDFVLNFFISDIIGNINRFRIVISCFSVNNMFISKDKMFINEKFSFMISFDKFFDFGFCRFKFNLLFLIINL